MMSLQEIYCTLRCVRLSSFNKKIKNRSYPIYGEILPNNFIEPNYLRTIMFSEISVYASKIT